MKLVDKFTWFEKLRKRMETMLLMALFLLGATAVEAGTFKIDLEGCKAGPNNGYHLEQVQGQSGLVPMYLCNDAAYTDGNLKQWAELDMVPHRLTFENTTGAAVDFNFTVGGDYIDTNDPTLIGWDYITELTLDVPASDVECQAMVPIVVQSLDIDGENLHRHVIVQGFPDGVKCVADYNMRLAIGSSGYSGSSLQDYLLEGGGKQTLPLPAVYAMTLNKTMTAVRDGAIDWTITKSSSPANVYFEDTCSDDPSALERDVNITVSWVKLEPTPQGQVNVTTLISATNGAQRPIDISVVDTLYSGPTALNTMEACTKTLVANQANQEVCTHTFTIDEEDAVNLNDKAVATFSDPDYDVGILAEKEVTASSDVQNSGSNDDETAWFEDYEWIGGDTNLSYSVESVVGASGTFDNYTLGIKTREDVNWTSGIQTDSGNVTFQKKIHVAKGAQTVGRLYDRAFLFGSDGFETDSGINPLSIGLSSSASGVLTIVKVVEQDIIDENKTVVFNFTISKGGVPIKDVNITVPAGESSASITISGMELGIYNVAEDHIPRYEIVGNASQQVDLRGCKATVTFTNKLAVRPPAVIVNKVTHPEGHSAGWTMTLYKENNSSGWDVVSTGDTNSTGGLLLLDADTLTAGSYKIEETLKEGWYNVGSMGDCTFTYEGQNRDDYECTFGNAKYATIIIKKEIESNNSYSTRFSFTQEINSSITLELGDDESHMFENLKAYPEPPVTYLVTENTPPSNFILSGLECKESESNNSQYDLLERRVGIFLDPGETVECTFTNQIVENFSIGIEKRTNGQDADTLPGPNIPVGDTVEWTYVITNTGDVTLSTVNVIDSRGVSISCPSATLDVNESMTCTASGTATAGQYSNIGTVTAMTPEGAPISDDDPSHYFGEVPIVTHPSIVIEKSTNGHDADVAPGPIIIAGNPVNWNYIVRNNGDVALTDISVTDDQGESVSCPPEETTLAVGESMTCTASGTATAGQYSNIGTVTAMTPEGASVSDDDPSHYFGEEPIVENPSISIEKSTNGEDADVAPGPNIPVGDTVEWMYIVTNTGDVPLSTVNVTDSRGISVSCPPEETTLAVGESMTCTASGTATVGQYANIGTVTARTPEGASVSDDDPSHYLGVSEAVDPDQNETACPCDDINSDSSPALNNISALLMILMTLMFGIFFVRREEKYNRNER